MSEKQRHCVTASPHTYSYERVINHSSHSAPQHAPASPHSRTQYIDVCPRELHSNFNFHFSFPHAVMSKRSFPDAQPAANSPNATKRVRSSSTGVDVSSIPPGNLIFAVPKKKAVFISASFSFLRGSALPSDERSAWISHSKNMPISLVFLNAKDVAVFVGSGSVDLGITGEDIIAESGSKVDVQPTQMGQCRLCLQAPKHLCKNPPLLFAGQRVVTSFPNLTRQFFDKIDSEQGTSTSVQFVSGSVEAACGLGLGRCSCRPGGNRDDYESCRA